MNVQAPNDVRKFNFYQQYVWQSTDFENFQLWVLAMFRAIAEGAFGSSVLGGLEPVVAGGMAVQIDPGIAVNYEGRSLIHKTAAQVTLAADGSNPRRSLIVLRPVDTSMTNIPEPLNPMNLVPLHVKQEYSLVVIPGTPAGSPQYPAKQSGDVIVCGVKIAAGQSSLAQGDIDLSQTERTRTRRKKIRQVASDYFAQEDDEIIEVSCSGGDVAVILPVAQTVPGKEILCVKIDSSANVMSVSGNGGELVGVLNSVDVDTEGDSVKVYARETGGWRHF